MCLKETKEITLRDYSIKQTKGFRYIVRTLSKGGKK